MNACASVFSVPAPSLAAASSAVPATAPALLDNVNVNVSVIVIVAGQLPRCSSHKLSVSGNLNYPNIRYEFSFVRQLGLWLGGQGIIRTVGRYQVFGRTQFHLNLLKFHIYFLF